MSARANTRRLCVVPATGLMFLAASCGGEPHRARTEDETRQSVPVPACVIVLGSNSPSPGMVRSLREEQYWQLVYPGYDQRNRTIPTSAVACTGERLFDARQFEGIRSDRVQLQEGAIVLGGGGDRLRIVWLRSHQYRDGTWLGALALVRPMGETAELYAVGTFRGRPETTKLTLERAGDEMVIMARDDGCAAAKPGAPCDSVASAYLMRQGRLVRGATFDVERTAYGAGLEPGVYGSLKYRLEVAVKVDRQGIHLVEEVKVLDPADRILRKAQMDRLLAVKGDTMVPSEDPLWPRVYSGPGAVRDEE